MIVKNRLWLYSACIAAIILLICIHQICYFMPIFNSSGTFDPSSAVLRGESEPTFVKIPKLVHHMWKTNFLRPVGQTAGSSPSAHASASVSSGGPPVETLRWRSGCQMVIAKYDFKLFSDADLLAFVETHYQIYVPLFKSLKGVCKSSLTYMMYNNWFIDVNVIFPPIVRYG